MADESMMSTTSEMGEISESSPDELGQLISSDNAAEVNSDGNVEAILGNNSSSDSIFDTKRFFSLPSFSEKVLKEAKEQIYERIEGPLSLLEQEGHEVLASYQRERRNKLLEEKEQEDRMVQKTLDDLLIKGDPREYQRLLLETALSRNTIVNLGTGAGKTLIALQCIKEKHSASKGTKKSLFVVPSVALAIQHTFTLRSNLPHFKVETACYTTTSSKRARERFSKCDVLCATHGAILDLLMHWGDYISLSNFNLLVIDECHYARDNHPYNQLMTKFYHTLSPEERPHILGLTASPILNVKETNTDEHLLQLLEDLETTLDATLVSASGQSSYDASQWQSRTIREEEVEFRRSNRNRTIPTAKNLDLLPSRLREFKQLEDLYEEVGPLVLQKYSQVLLRELSRNHFESETPLEYAEATNYLNRLEEFCSHEIQVLPAMGRTDKLLALEQLVDDLIVYNCGSAHVIGLVFVERRITAMALHCYFRWKQKHCKSIKNWLSPTEARRQTLLRAPSRHDDQRKSLDRIFSDSSDDPSCNIFEPESTTTNEVTMQERVPVKSVALVRNPTQIFNSLSMSHKTSTVSNEQQLEWIHKETKLRDTMTRLRDGEINLMFATSVVEEGVDVQSCSFVIAFDGISNIKSYIQMKGRARQKNASFFLLHDPRSLVEKLTLSSAQGMEKRIQRLIEEKMKEKTEAVIVSSIEQPIPASLSGMPPELAAIKEGFYKAGEATVDIQSAKSLLFRYFLSIPIEPYMRSRRETLVSFLPMFVDNQLDLPPHLPLEVRRVILPNSYQTSHKKEKEKVLSLMACVRLHRFGLLNERLLPLSANDVNSQVTELLPVCKAVETKRIRRTLFDGNDCGHIYVYPVKQEGHGFSAYEEKLRGMGHCLGIVTLEPIKSMLGPICLAHKEFGGMEISLQAPIKTSCSIAQWELLRKVFVVLMNFRWSRHRKGISYQVRAENGCDAVIPSYAVGVLSKELAPDWKFMSTLVQECERSEEERRCSTLQDAGNSFLAQPRIWTPSYAQSFAKYIVFNATERSCDDTFPHVKEGIHTYRDYFQKTYSVHVSGDEPLFEAQYMWTSQSGLSMTSNESDMDVGGEMPSFKTIELPASVCLEAPLANAHVALLTVFLPQLLYVFERHQIAEAFIQHSEQSTPIIGSLLRKLSNEKVSVALTAKSSNLEENYEKVEWLGDAVLKLLQTDSLVKSKRLRDSSHYLHEGNLSMLRASMGSNTRLAETCVKLGLDRYILSQSLSRGSWVPSPLTALKQDPAEPKQQLPTKSRADVLESILGLLYVEFGYTACVNVGNELGLSLLLEEAETSAQPKRPEVSKSDQMSTVQECTGYNAFIQPQLFAEAFSHPTAIDSTVPSYQRLEWIGDAVVCLCVREWLFRRCANDLELRALVLMEDAIVSNETFGWLSMKHGLPHFLNHRDLTLPGRIEAYMSRVRAGGSLWITDPPKTIADITESVLGAVHMDGNFDEGQAAALQMLDPIFQIVDETMRESAVDSMLRAMEHPKRSLQELAGELLELQDFQEARFATLASDTTRPLSEEQWSLTAKEGSGFVATVKLLDRILVALSGDSASLSSNRAAFLVMQALHHNPILLERIKKCQAHVARGSALSLRNDDPEL